MNLAALKTQAQDWVSILSNPSQSAVAAAGVAGAFSAEANNLRQAAQADLAKFGVNIPTPLKGLFQQAIAPFQQVLNGSASNPIPASGTGTILGLSYLTFAVVLVVGIVGAVLFSRK